MDNRYKKAIDDIAKIPEMNRRIAERNNIIFLLMLLENQKKDDRHGHDSNHR